MGGVSTLDSISGSGVQSIDRVFLIMELLSKHPKGISLTEVCAATSLPKSTASRMLAVLVRHGYAIQEVDTKRYRLTLRLFELGSRVADSNNAAGTILPSLSDRRQAVLDDHTVREIHPQPSCGFQVHRALIRISAVIIYNILLPEPAV